MFNCHLSWLLINIFFDLEKTFDIIYTLLRACTVHPIILAVYSQNSLCLFWKPFYIICHGLFYTWMERWLNLASWLLLSSTPSQTSTWCWALFQFWLIQPHTKQPDGKVLWFSLESEIENLENYTKKYISDLTPLTPNFESQSSKSIAIAWTELVFPLMNNTVLNLINWSKEKTHTSHWQLLSLIKLLSAAECNLKLNDISSGEIPSVFQHFDVQQNSDLQQALNM